ncbi:MAG: hypothetical protein ACYTEQ_06830, partial [Planctomycetota bacterium]
HVSFLGGDDGLRFLQLLQNFRAYAGEVAVLVITVWLFAIFPFLTGVMGAIESSEHKRIEKADPKPAE